MRSRKSAQLAPMGHMVLYMPKRKFFPDAVNHCYQRSAAGGLLFYTQRDYLVWFTTVCTVAPRYKVKILSMCPMPDHTHMAIVAQSRKDFYEFMGDSNRRFAKTFNDFTGQRGSVFESTFGSAPKLRPKDIRSCLIYIGNNPVERQLSKQAETYRWTFLAYASSKHPFSSKVVLRNVRWKLRKSVEEVRALHKLGKPLNYLRLHNLYDSLDKAESEQLTDYIISTYNVIDYEAALDYFGGNYDDMVHAMQVSTGSEHDLSETRIGKTDTCYNKMTNMILKKYGLEDIHEILSWPAAKKEELFWFLRMNTNYMARQICKFLHLPVENR